MTDTFLVEIRETLKKTLQKPSESQNFKSTFIEGDINYNRRFLEQYNPGFNNKSHKAMKEMDSCNFEILK